MFYGLDFEARTVTLLNSITLEGQDSQFMGSAYRSRIFAYDTIRNMLRPSAE